MSREKVKKFDLLFFEEMIKVETDSGTCYVSKKLSKLKQTAACAMSPSYS